MPRKLYPHDLLVQIRNILIALEVIHPHVRFSPLDPAPLAAEADQIRSLEAQISDLRKQILELQLERESLCLAAWDRVKRIRFGIKSLYGDDSVQYQHVGGTRVSDRKRWTRRQVQK